MEKSLEKMHGVLISHMRKVEEELHILIEQRKILEPKIYEEKHERLTRTLYGIRAHLTDIDNLIESEK